MKNLFKVLKIAKPYKIEIFCVFLFGLLVILFSLFSLATLIPILKVLINNVEPILEIPVYKGILDIKNFLEKTINYNIYNSIIQNGKIKVLEITCIFAGAAFVLKNIFRYFASMFAVKIRNTIERDIRNKLYKKILNLHIGYFSDKNRGDLISHFTTDIVEIQNAILNSISMIFKDPIMIIASLIILFIMSPQLTIFVLVTMPIGIIIISFVGKNLKKIASKEKSQQDKLLSILDETISGISIVKAFVSEKRTYDKFLKSNHIDYKLKNSVMFRREMSSPISEVIGSFIIILIIWFGGKLILEQQSLEPEIFITYLMFFYQIIPHSKSISTAFYDIRRASASVDRIWNVLYTKNEIKDSESSIEINDFKDEIVFDSISFSYGREDLIKEFSLTIKKGQNIALVGKSGGGKSTLIKLLPRFYDIEKGNIYLDKTDIRDIKKHSLRSLIAMVTQDSILFNDTVYNNITMGLDTYTQQEVINAAKVANAHEFITQLKYGYQTNIGQGGNKLSGGQKQRLCIARAILKNPPIMLLDEATSSLDAESEIHLQKALDNIIKEKTSIIVAHRLSTIQRADIIVVIEKGRIVEKGSHRDLLDKKSVYHKLIQLQSFD
ncbi:ABC transporter ATP-binding protein [Ichthyobacterium seriolicida]|uniref:Multidrug ABC transporter ATPase and permease n=1 Tax=Ichthyobacterium seriolicida TaxID=242600 RepID=A0A1J1EC92_9FLAO|nr:ABC transporter ATP-binding protein [Ichthyobacterium seriolicida]BAV95128.1 multidrug ABC transporter ATPase and permease [Ichthyobacterium seriolicida]